MKKFYTLFVLGIMFACLQSCKKDKVQNDKTDSQKFVIIGKSYTNNQLKYSVVWTESERKVFTPEDGDFVGAHILNPGTEKTSIGYYGYSEGKVIFFSNGIKQQLAKVTGKVLLPFQIGERITSHTKDEKGNTYIFCDAEYGSGNIVMGVTAYYYKISATGEFTVKGAGNGSPIMTDFGVQYINAFTNGGTTLLCYHTKEDYSIEGLSFSTNNGTNLKLLQSIATKEKVFFILSSIDAFYNNTGYLLVSLDLKTKLFKQQKLNADNLEMYFNNSFIYNDIIYLTGENLTKNEPFYATINLANQSDSQSIIKNNLSVKAGLPWGSASLIHANKNGVFIAGYQNGTIYWQNGILKELDQSGLESNSPEFIMSY